MSDTDWPPFRYYYKSSPRWPLVARADGDDCERRPTLAGVDLAGLQARLDDGAPIDAPGIGGLTLLHVAAHGARDEFLPVLLARGADVNARDARGRTPLHLLFERNHYDGPRSFRQGVFTSLLDAGADVHARDNAGNTALLHAAAEGWFWALEVLAQYSGTVRAVNALGEGALHLAARYAPDLAVVDLLLANGADPNARTASGASVLHYLHRYDPRNERSQVHEVSDQLGRRRTPGGLAGSLRRAGARADSLAIAANFGFEDELHRLLNAGADPDERDPLCADVPVHLAARHDDDTALAILLSGGADASVSSARGLPILHEAACWGATNVIELLLARGADPNAVDSLGRTPLHCAAVVGQRDVAGALIDRGARRDLPAADGDLPVDKAYRARGRLVWAGGAHGIGENSAEFARLITLLRPTPDYLDPRDRPANAGRLYFEYEDQPHDLVLLGD